MTTSHFGAEVPGSSSVRRTPVPNPPSSGPVLLSAERVSKTFGRVKVLSSVDLKVQAGEVRGLLGQNGSGKSTLIKILCGYHRPDPGAALLLDGEQVHFPVAPEEIGRRGLSVMHQDLGVEGTLTVLDNFLIQPGTQSALGRIRWRREASRVSDMLVSFGFDIDVHRLVGELTGAERAGVALARAVDRLAGRPGILVLDEPTATLERGSVERLLEAVREVRRLGCAVIYVSHDLGEIREICDTVTVLRDGAVVSEGQVADYTEADLIMAIVGRDLGDLYPGPSKTNSAATRETVLATHQISGRQMRDASLELRAGEILGVTGLAGMGHDELPELIFGSRPLRGGDIELCGQPHRPSPRRSLRAGVVLVVADRKERAGDQASPVRENLTIPVTGRYFRGGRMRRGDELRDVRAVLESFDVRPPDPHRPLGQLSGGNQQKALLGKWLSLFGNPKVLLLHEPTQGVDVGARQEIFARVRRAASDGLAVLYVSTEYEDLANMADRVLVVRHGAIRYELGRGDFDGHRLAALAMASGRDPGREA